MKRSSLIVVWTVLPLVGMVMRTLGAVPVSPSNLTCAADSQTQITLAWADNSSNETGFKIERSLTGTNGWSQIATMGANTTSFADTNLGCNTVYYYRSRAYNSDGDSDYSNVASTYTAYCDNGTPVWRTLLLIYTNTDTDYVQGGIREHLTATMPQSEMLKATWSFRQYASLAQDCSERECIIQYDIIYVARPVNSVTDRGGENYWLSPTDAAPELDQYAPSGRYDSVLVHWYRSAIPCGDWGLGQPASASSHGATYGTVTDASDAIWNVPTAGEVWLNVWLRGSCPFYADKGYRQPTDDADGGSGHGYVWSSQTGWTAYYRDLMTGRVWETNPPPAYTGVASGAWRSGTITGGRYQVQADYFYLDTLTQYEKQGTATWQSADGNVALGTSTAGNNTIYTALRPDGTPTITGRLYVPSTGVGAYDSVAVALREDTTEWWATLEYGTGLTRQLSLMQNDFRQATYPMALPAGWYTVKVQADYANHTIRMKAWTDGTNEPADWQISAPLGTWVASKVGFRHYGQGTFVDDLFATVDRTYGAPVWRALLLIYPNTDTDYVQGGVREHLTATMPQSEMLKATWSFRQAASLAHDCSKRECIIQYDIIYVARPVNSVSDLGGENYWLSPTDTASELDQYAPPGRYDSILVHWYRSTIPSTGWGWGMSATSWAHGATYCTVTDASDSSWNQPIPGEPWMHEWLHGSCPFYSDRGYRQPNGNADGASSHGYIWSSQTGWTAYYRDLMTGRVWETNPPPAYTGVAPEAWRSGTITGGKYQVQADYFYLDTLTQYGKQGTASWQSADGNVALGTSSPGNNTVYTTLRLGGTPTITGRLYVPSTGVGAYDSVAVALRDDTTEWWATLEYGSGLTRQLSLMQNDSRQATYPMALPAGWYTVKVQADYASRTIRMKAWTDGTNEPTDWQLSAPLGTWVASKVGFRHYGQGTYVDDLFATVSANSPPLLQSMALTGSTIRLAWAAIPGRKYQVQYKTSLNQTTWSNLGSVINASSAAMITLDANASDPSRFYRLVLEP